MDLGGYRHLPIVNSANIATGIISSRDVLRFLSVKYAHQRWCTCSFDWCAAGVSNPVIAQTMGTRSELSTSSTRSLPERAGLSMNEPSLNLLLLGDRELDDFQQVVEFLRRHAMVGGERSAVDFSAVRQLVAGEGWHPDLVVVLEAWPDQFFSEARGIPGS